MKNGLRIEREDLENKTRPLRDQVLIELSQDSYEAPWTVRKRLRPAGLFETNPSCNMKLILE